MTYKPISNRAVSLWAFVAGLEGLLALFFVTRGPSEAESALFFGLSAQRLAIVIGVLLLVILFLGIAIAHFYRIASWSEAVNRNPRKVRYLSACVFIAELLVLHWLFFIPDYRFPILIGYLPRLKPVLIWLAFLFAQTAIFLAYYGYISLEDLKEWQGKRPVFIVLVIITFAWGLVALTGIGIIPDELYWNVAGVPILAGQVWIGIGITLIAWFLHKKIGMSSNSARLSSPVIFIVIWVAAAIIWVNTPLGPTFNAPGPYPPSRGFYPFVDAALFDLGAQSAIYGKGLFFGSFIDRGLLSGFLALLHMVFGQDYLVVVGVQSAVFAVFPALVYLVGEKLHSKAAGIMAATLAILKVSNAITGGKFISTSHPKLMLTEFPTGIILVLFSFFLIQWLRKSNAKAHHLAGIGATVGIGILLRHNVLFLFPVMFIMGLFVWRLRWKLALRDVFLVIAAFFITISPWMVRNQRVAGEPLFFMLHFNSVIEERYQPESNLEQPRTISTLPSRSLSAHPSLSRRADGDILDLDQYEFIPKHFVHNIITSTLILPPSPVLDDFRHVIDTNPYWDRIGDASLGDISGSTGLFLAFNLIILSIGIGTAWKRARFAALAPVMVFLFYNLANAFARTSGGRYIVPVDWVIYFYYAIGLVEIIRFFISSMRFQANGFLHQSTDNRPVEGDSKLDWGKYGLSVLPFFLIVTMLPLIELASPGEKPPETADSLMETLEENSFFENSGISRLQVEQFLDHPDAILLSGHGLYPRYYSYDQGEPILPGQISPYTPREFPRLVFTLLLPHMNRTVLLPIDEPRLNFPDGAEVIVGGCQVGEIRNDVLTPYLSYIDAAFVVVRDETQTAFIRVPEAPLVCPLREPVCDNNRNCK